MKKRGVILAIIIASISALSSVPPQVRLDGRSGEAVNRVRSFAGTGARYPGAKANKELEKKVTRLFKQSGLKNGSMTFKAPLFQPGKTVLRADGEALEILPMHPTLFRPGNFKEDRFSASLIYLGRGEQADIARLKGRDLSNAIAVMDLDSGANYLHFLRFGIRGFIFIKGKKEASYRDSRLKVYRSEISIPRFYAPGKTGERLKRLALEKNTIEVEAEPSRWENGILSNPWVFIPGRDKALSRKVAVVYAPLDANAVVPSLAQGAQSAANLHLLVRMLKSYQNNPPKRSVLLVAVNAHTQGYLGERILSWNLLADQDQWNFMTNQILLDIQKQTRLLELYGKIDLSPEKLQERDHFVDMEEYLVEMRNWVDTKAGFRFKVKDALVKEAKAGVNKIRAKQLALKRMNLSDEEFSRRLDEVTQGRHKYANVLTLFNKVGIQTKLSDLSEEELDILRGYVKTIMDRNRTWIALNKRTYRRYKANRNILDVMGGRSVVFVTALDLCWRGNELGFASRNGTSQKWQYAWGKTFGLLAASHADRGNQPPLLVDTMTKEGGLPETYYWNEQNHGYGLGAFQAGGPVPAFVLADTHAVHGNAFTLYDTYDRLSGRRVAVFSRYIISYMRHVLNSARLSTVETKRSARPRFRGDKYGGLLIRAYRFDKFSASVLPELPVENAVVFLNFFFGANGTEKDVVMQKDVSKSFYYYTDERATAFFPGIFIVAPGSGGARPITAAFRYGSDFRSVDYALDSGKIEEKRGSGYAMRGSDNILPLFNCFEVPILNEAITAKISASTIDDAEFILLDATKNVSPDRYGFTGFSDFFSVRNLETGYAPGAYYVEKGHRFKVLAQTNPKVIAINAKAGTETESAAAKGEGFTGFQDLGPDFLAKSIGDMRILTRYRLNKMKGVTNELIDIFMSRAVASSKKMKEALNRQAPLDYLKHFYHAFGAQLKAYGQIQTMTSDMLKTIILYMALLVPFCFFTSKLLFNFSKIESQMATFSVFFVVTFIAFRLIHPAFAIAQAPEAIFVAFVMLILGLFTVYILQTRFEGEMKLIFSKLTTMDDTEVGASTVGQNAMLIGVNNMKRRRLRTILTTMTILLVTFTMLSFSSISQKMSPTVVKLKESAPYTGLQFKLPGTLEMEESVAYAIKDIFFGRGEVVERRWLRLRRDRQDSIPTLYIASGRGTKAGVNGVLGLSPREDGFITSLKMVCGRFFEDKNADEVILTTGLAAALGVNKANYRDTRITFQERQFRIAGIIDGPSLLGVRGLNKKAIVPIKPEVKMQMRADDESKFEQNDPAQEDDSGVFYVPEGQLLIMPVGTSRQIGASPMSLSIKLRKASQIWPLVDHLLTATEGKFYIGAKTPFYVGEEKNKKTRAGLYFVGEGYSTTIGGLSRLIIPLIIAATIILNTMLGSVYERESEIAIYNAIGLNPTHIAIFFLSEAFVYSVIGSVGGYLIGQGTSLALANSGLMEGINLNFSSLSVVYVILFTIGIVMLSTLYPAMVATKTAVPSGKREWTYPEHDGVHMTILFPFIYHRDIVLGVIAYLHEYFSSFTEASVGELIAEYSGKSIDHDENGEVYRLHYHLALAPYDLGVTEDVEFNLKFNSRVDAYQLSMENTRISGQDSNWVATNKPMLVKLRKYLMNWRRFDAAEHGMYVQQAKAILEIDQADKDNA